MKKLTEGVHQQKYCPAFCTFVTILLLSVSATGNDNCLLYPQVSFFYTKETTISSDSMDLACLS